MPIESPLSIHQKIDVIKSLDPLYRDLTRRYLIPIDEAFTGFDSIPDFSEPEEVYLEKIRQLKLEAQGLPDEFLIVMAGNTITEEGLPLYMSALNNVYGLTDETGIDKSGIAEWVREWTAQEETHGTRLKTWMMITGRYNMHAISRTIGYLIRNGLSTPVERDPFRSPFFTKWQEAQAKVSHRNGAKFARKYNSPLIDKAQQDIAKQEGSHEAVNQGVVSALVNHPDPLVREAAIIEWHNVWEQEPHMPGARMAHTKSTRFYKGQTPLYLRYSMFAQALGILTGDDYVSELESELKVTRLSHMSLTGNAAKAQEGLYSIARNLRTQIDEAMSEVPSRDKDIESPWIFNRPASVTNAQRIRRSLLSA